MQKAEPLAPHAVAHAAPATQPVQRECADQRGDILDTRPAAVVQRHLQELAGNSSNARHFSAMQQMMGASPIREKQGGMATMMNGRSQDSMQRLASREVAQDVAAQRYNGEQVELVQRKANPNNTGLPDRLKSGIESLSGMSMDHVKVHYNSANPAQLHAHAYAQGSEIHVAPGQEQHLPHEAWHVVQQAQGRVRPTMQMKQGGVQVNDDVDLEAEADAMGAMALRSSNHGLHQYRAAPNYATVAIQRISITGTGAFPQVNAMFAVDQPVFDNPAKNSIDAQIPALDEDEPASNVNLYFGQNYLNDELSRNYYNNPDSIAGGKAKIVWDWESQDAVIRDGHHRVVWGLYHQKEVGIDVVNGRDGPVNLSNVTFKGTPQPVAGPPKVEEQKLPGVQA